MESLIVMVFVLAFTCSALASFSWRMWKTCDRLKASTAAAVDAALKIGRQLEEERKIDFARYCESSGITFDDAAPFLTIEQEAILRGAMRRGGKCAADRITAIIDQERLAAAVESGDIHGEG